MRTTTGSWGLHRDEMQVLRVNANENHHLLLINPHLSCHCHAPSRGEEQFRTPAAGQPARGHIGYWAESGSPEEGALLRVWLSLQAQKEALACSSSLLVSWLHLIPPPLPLLPTPPPLLSSAGSPGWIGWGRWAEKRCHDRKPYRSSGNGGSASPPPLELSEDEARLRLKRG